MTVPTVPLDALPLPALLIDAEDERILSANAGALELLGQGITQRHFITTLRQPGVLDAVDTCLRDGGTHTTRYLTSDGGQDATYVVTCTNLKSTGGGVLVTFEDMTHLTQAGQMRRDFIANVSHELRSPLTAILGFIETLRGPARDDTAATERFLSIMQDEAERMERLVRDLLSLSRVESEERIRPTQQVNLSDIISAVLHTLRPVSEGADVTIKTATVNKPILLPGDEDQLRQVVTNLIENAIKYGGSGKTVYLTFSTTDQEPTIRGPAAVIAVRDEGPGIKTVDIPRLTERFYRVDDHRSREMGGTGLGLAIVKHILNRHRGRLRIESTLGQGSEFRVVLPIVPPAKPG